MADKMDKQTAFQIKTITGRVLFECGAGSVKPALERAVGQCANLRDANLAGANLAGANLAGADLIDAGQDKRGHRFWCWARKDSHVVYRAGCREWSDYEQAKAHYGADYQSDGDVDECLARLALMHGIAERRGWLKTK